MRIKNKMKIQNKTLYLLIILFAIFGIILAGTLTLAKYYDKVAVLCGEDQFNSCNTVQNSPYSYLINQKTNSGTEFKIPLTLAGVGFYTLLTLIALSLYRYETGKKKLEKKCLTRQKYFLFIFGILGVIFSAWFTYIQASIIKAFCKYCLVSAFNTLILFILITTAVFFVKEEKELKIKRIKKKK